MDELQFLGYLISAVITLGGFIAIILKFIQPINDLRIVIQKLNDTIDTLKSDNAAQNKKLDEHGEKIDKLEHRTDKLELKMKMFHKEG